VIERTLAPRLLDLAGHYPVVTLTGPRQAGKTTLCRAVFPDKPYVSLELLEAREYATRDPRGFLAEHSRGAVVDDVQHAPELLSYLQVEVDERPEHGRFVLTGSQHFGLTERISQSLAGRTAVLHLLPLELAELRRFGALPRGLFEVLWAGSYPRIHDRGIPPHQWLADYVTTYVQRDVRQVLNVTDLETFSTFLKLCAGRTSQEINLSALGDDAGVTHTTARSWLSVLEASFLCFRVPGWHRNLRKQTIKAHKLHFFDSGLVCYLLGIRDPEHLRHHPLRGAVFESWVASEVYKARAHRGLRPELFHYRDAKGLEVDLVLETSRTVLVEVKSGATVNEDFFKSLRQLAQAALERGAGESLELRLVYGGESPQRRSDLTVVPWSEVDAQDWS